jgi:hypothetical protein
MPKRICDIKKQRDIILCHKRQQVFKNNNIFFSGSFRQRGKLIETNEAPGQLSFWFCVRHNLF